MMRHRKTRAPRGVAARWGESRRKVILHSFENDGEDEGVTFRVADLADGSIPKTSTVHGPAQPDADAPGLDAHDRAEVLATMAAAERSIQPDRLPLLVVLVCVLLALIFGSGITGRWFSETRERMIEQRIRRPYAGQSWRHRIGADREKLGLPPMPDAGRAP